MRLGRRTRPWWWCWTFEGAAADRARSSLPNSNVFFYAEDLQQTYTELSARGVRFPLAPVEQPFGWWSLFEDPDGNRFALVPPGQ